MTRTYTIGGIKENMKVITINLPSRYLQAIQVLNDMGTYPSRSEVIRVALHQFLTNELKLERDLDSETFKMLMRSKGDNN